MSQEVKPQEPPQSKGLFGEGGYRTFLELREFVKKAPNEQLPGTGTMLYVKERVQLIEELQKYAARVGQSYSISEQTWRELILPEIKKEEYQLYSSGKTREMKQLQGKIQQIQK